MPILSEQAEMEARVLADAGRYAEAVELLAEHNRRAPNPEWERALAHWRFLAFHGRAPQPTTSAAWPPAIDDPFADVAGIPEIGPERLDSRTLGAGIQRHGGLIVRGLIDEETAARLADGIRHAIDDSREHGADKPLPPPTPYYARLPLPVEEPMVEHGRPWVESAGGVWTADSPRMLSELIELVGRTGVVDAITGYFGERPMLSVGKSTLRCVPPTLGSTDWHQDGAFLGEHVRTVNLWLCLSHCGVDASGLDILPKRVPRILPTGTPGSWFSWSIAHDVVVEEAADLALTSPVFAPGDAMLFDHYLVHRTSFPPGITKDRYAIESWFFAPSGYAADQLPLLV